MQMINRFVRQCILVVSILGLAASSLQAEVSPRKYAVEVSAQVQSSPAQIVLQWPADSEATGYSVSRKTLSATSWTALGSLPGAATSFTDQNVSIGNAYEYQILKTTSGAYSGSGYIYAGINAQMIENRGKLVLVVDNTHAAALATELARLEQDLIGDGWTVIRHDVPRTATPPTVKALIKSAYDADPANVKSVFLFGHVAVPYSGNLAPDGHPDHQGAWAADTYYADMNGSWTDNIINNSSAQKLWNRNIPGDGKFDQSSIPSDLELQVGRVDLFNMTCYANKVPSRSELDLLRNYLNKDHKFRHGQMPLERRGLVCDNFGESWGEAFASSGWRNFAPAFGANNNVQVPYGTFFSTLNTQGYLWAYGTGGGSWYTCNGIGGSDDFALNDIKAVFTLFLGSYFGDWDNESNFLRAPLGSSSYTLASAWAGRPHWFMHHMALGETIGLSARLSQNNNNSLYRAHQNHGTRQIHTALLGDPTLRLHPVRPPSNLLASQSPGGVVVSWQPSPDSNIQGYLVYRATNPKGPFARVSGNNFVTQNTFTDSTGTASHTYMVRAVKLEQSGAGTYYNPSQGLFSNEVGGEPAPEPTLTPATPSGLAVTAVFPTMVQLSWTDNSSNEKGFRIYRKTGTGNYLLVGITAPGITVFHSKYLTANTAYSFRVHAYNDEGASDYSNAVTVQTPAAILGGAGAALITSIESLTRGNWRSSYGSEGYDISGDANSLPSYVTLSRAGAQSWVWNSNPSDISALERAAGNGRIAAAHYADNAFTVTFAFNDANYHRTAFYFLDWEGTGREQMVEAFEANTGQLLSGRKLTGFQGGTYLVYNLKGAVTFQIRALKGTPVLSGIFFGGPSTTQVAQPVLTPNGGNFVLGDAVAMSCSTVGAVIHYTIDGTTPTLNSPKYSFPIKFNRNAVVKARAFKAGLEDSPVASANFTLVQSISPNKAQFLGLNTTRGGSWKGQVGGAGHWISGDTQSLPAGAALSLTGKSDWVWVWNTADTRALERSSSGRLAACAYAGGSFELDLNLGAKTHKVSLHMLDWDNAGRTQKIEVLDYTSRQVLHTQNVSGFSNGVYLEYALEGRVIIRLTQTGPSNAVLSGLFFDNTTLDL